MPWRFPLSTDSETFEGNEIGSHIRVTTDSRLAELEANAQHTRERYRLYRAKALGPTPTNPDRLRQLQREAERAEGLAAGARASRASN